MISFLITALTFSRHHRWSPMQAPCDHCHLPTRWISKGLRKAVGAERKPVYLHRFGDCDSEYISRRADEALRHYLGEEYWK